MPVEEEQFADVRSFYCYSAARNFRGELNIRE